MCALHAGLFDCCVLGCVFGQYVVMLVAVFVCVLFFFVGFGLFFFMFCELCAFVCACLMCVCVVWLAVVCAFVVDAWCMLCVCVFGWGGGLCLVHVL